MFQGLSRVGLIGWNCFCDINLSWQPERQRNQKLYNQMGKIIGSWNAKINSELAVVLKVMLISTNKCVESKSKKKINTVKTMD